MSWSVNAMGKAAAVAAKLAEQFAKIKCTEPEETIKNLAAEQVKAALGAFPDGTAVRVTASGSQSTSSGADGKATNSLSMQIEPLWGFVE